MSLSIGGLDFDSILQIPEQVAAGVTQAVTDAMDHHVAQANTSSDTNISIPSNVTPAPTQTVQTGGFKAAVEHGITVALQVISLVLKVGFFLPPQIRTDLTFLQRALQDVYGWLD